MAMRRSRFLSCRRICRKHRPKDCNGPTHTSFPNKMQPSIELTRDDCNWVVSCRSIWNSPRRIAKRHANASDPDEWDADLTRRFWRFWRILVARARRQAAGDLDMTESTICSSGTRSDLGRSALFIVLERHRAAPDHASIRRLFRYFPVDEMVTEIFLVFCVRSLALQ